MGKKVGDKMVKANEIISECLAYEGEREWFEFKENWFALSNSAAILGKECAYMIWGITDLDHKIVGTSFNCEIEINNEPLKHYLARNLSPSVNFYFLETIMNNHRLVVLVIPSAKTIPTSYKDIRYIRIGSSKEKLKKYPEREAFLFSVLTFGLPTITNIKSEYQDLTFNQLKAYYVSKNILLNSSTFLKNLHLLTKDGKFNIMAQLLSDNSHVPIRVAIFEGKTKASGKNKSF